MMGRERNLAIAVGSVLGLVVAYQVVKGVFIDPRNAAEERITVLMDQEAEAKREIDKARRLCEDWKRVAGRTYSSGEAENRFDKDLKKLLDRHHLRGPPPSTRVTKEIARKTGITSVSSSITAEGDYADAMAFIRDLYETPFICRISDLRIRAAPTGRRNDVEIKLSVESPLLPRIAGEQAKEIRLGTVKTLDQLEDPPTDPARPERPAEESYAVLAERNILKKYIPPPENFVTVVNEDWQAVTVTIEPFWEGEPYGSQLETVVEGKKSEVTRPFKGDAVKVLAVYTSDGSTFGPERLTGGGTLGQWIWKVPVHSDEPEGSNVDLAVNNQDGAEVDLIVVVTDSKGQSVTKPTMRISPGGQIDIEVYEDVQSVKVSATYASGMTFESKTFTPKKGKQVYTIVKEGETPPEIVEVAETDCPANPDLTLTGMTTYPGVHEMIAGNSRTRERVIIATGQVVDCGKLLAVHTQGGVVFMPETGNYYLYPFGRLFSERAQLEVGSDATQEEIAEAIAAWALADGLAARG